MLKVLLVDDEPFILQGLQVLVDWEKEGYEVPLTAANGEEALHILLEQHVDLVISDINMPVMTGLELLRQIRQVHTLDTWFVILSGYAEFSYAQEAMRYDCTDYILKPVEKDVLISLLRKVSAMKKTLDQETEEGKKNKKAYLDRNLIALVLGKYDQKVLDYLQKHMEFSDEMRYIEVQLDTETATEDFSDEEKRGYLRKLYEACIDFLKEHANHCVFDVAGHEKIYDVGFLYCDYMAKQRQLSEKAYLETF